MKVGSDGEGSRASGSPPFVSARSKAQTIAPDDAPERLDVGRATRCALEDLTQAADVGVHGACVAAVIASSGRVQQLRARPGA